MIFPRVISPEGPALNTVPKKAVKALNFNTKLKQMQVTNKNKSIVLSNKIVPKSLFTGIPVTLYRLVQRTSSPALGKMRLAKYPAAIAWVAWLALDL